MENKTALTLQVIERDDQVAYVTDGENEAKYRYVTECDAWEHENATAGDLEGAMTKYYMRTGMSEVDAIHAIQAEIGRILGE